MPEIESGVAVLLNIYSLAVRAGEKQTQQQELQAQLFQKGKAVYIRYNEELEGNGSVSTTIKVEERQVTIIRHGAVRMNHVYRLGEKTTSMYQTPHGALEMEADTTQLEFKHQDTFSLTGSSALPSGGPPVAQLTLSYNLALQEQDVGQFTLELRMQEQER